MAIPALSPSHAFQLDLLSPSNESTGAGTFALTFPPPLVRQLIHSWSSPGDVVLDPFLGQGAAVIEAQLMGRRSVGVDCNLSRFTMPDVLVPDLAPALHEGDARAMAFLENNSIDLIVTQPPYGNTHPFSKNNPRDLSLLSHQDFLRAMEQTAAELYRVLRSDGICAVLIGDIKDRGRMMPLGFQLVHRFLSCGFSVLQVTDVRPHEYLLLFRKKQQAPKRLRSY